MFATKSTALEDLRKKWESVWADALAVWSQYVQLHDPAWCLTVTDEKEQQLFGSFAMIRLVDHSVVISVRRIEELGLQEFGKEILAHEIGHHVYCPGDLTDNARLLARIRAGLPTREHMAPMVSNLYADLLINDWLQRTQGLNIAGVYQKMAQESGSRVWTLYMRIYEALWKLPKGTLAKGTIDARLEQDSQLAARLIRSYSKDWLEGAGRFAVLCLPYVVEDDEERLRQLLQIWNDTRDAGRGGCPNGLTELEDAERAGAIHPAEDPELSGVAGDEADDSTQEAQNRGKVAGEHSGRKTPKNYRQPFEYREILKAAGSTLSDRELTAQYYRERALPHLISFPVKRLPRATDPLPEGTELWDVASPMDQIDWIETLLASPTVIPGVTTRERYYGESPGSDTELLPFDLYLGVDCSGSMSDPAYHMSYPVLAGAILALSALRAGSRAKVVLSGEPGKTISTDGFIRDRATILLTLTNYLGTGYSFGIHRLAETFLAGLRHPRPIHVLIISDNDMFSMLDERGSGRIGWDVASESLQRCGGGGTFVLQLPGQTRSANWPQATQKYLTRIQGMGWNVGLVNSMEELVAFATQFSRAKFQR
jgi:hypothetical protein